jgi:hemerythrin superfamily protein
MSPEGMTQAVQGFLTAVTPVHGGALSKNIIQLIVEDHDRARSLWQQYNMPGTTARQKSTIAWTMIRESSVHSAKEEEVLYPAMRAAMGDLEPDHCLHKHQKLKVMLDELSNSSITDPNFDGKFQDYMLALVDHMKEEEEDLLQRFVAAEGVTNEYLMQLAKQFETAKLFAPSRPHPWAPNKPPLNIAANASVAPLDFVRDLIRFEGAPPL